MCFLAVSCLWGKLDKTATFFIRILRNKRKEVVTDKRTIKKGDEGKAFTGKPHSYTVHKRNKEVDKAQK